MSFKTTMTGRDGTVYWVPTGNEIWALREGDLALDPYGRWAEVLEIFARSRDVNGNAFACVRVRHGRSGTITMSYHEGQLVRTLSVTLRHTSAECDDLEILISKYRNEVHLESLAIS